MQGRTSQRRMQKSFRVYAHKKWGVNLKIACVAAEDISLGFGYVISYLKQRGDDVRLFFDPCQFARGYARSDLLANLIGVRDRLCSDIDDFNPDIVCFSVVTAHYKWGLELAKRIKERMPKVRIFFGGVHPTLVPEEVRKHDFIDDVIVGDGIEYFGGEFDPDKIFPDREIFLKELPPEHRKIQLFMTGVGCPFSCSYCGQEQLRAVGQFKFKRRSAEGCIDELIQIKRSGAEYILFVDDIFIINKDWLENFLRNYGVFVDLPFSCFVHPKFVTEDIMKLLKESGCQSAWMGIQTGFFPLRRDILNRKETNEEIEKACKIIKDQGIKLLVDHIFGIPFENEISNDISHALYSKIKPDVINCYQLLYFPKAKIIDHALRCNYLQKEDVEKINRGEGIVYQQGNKGQKYYDMYAKSFVAIPLGSVIFEILPMWLLKIIILIKAGRGFTILACLQNEFFFTWKSICKKLSGAKVFTKR